MREQQLFFQLCVKFCYVPGSAGVYDLSWALHGHLVHESINEQTNEIKVARDQGEYPGIGKKRKDSTGKEAYGSEGTGKDKNRY